MPMTANEIIELLQQSLKYTPIVYKQSLYTTNQYEFGNEFVLEYKYTDIPEDSLLFFVPSISSNESGNCKLTLKVPVPSSDGTYNYASFTYDILVEENDGAPRYAGKGDIVAHRMCIFRFRRREGQILLCNSPLYNDATYSNLRVVNCKFVNPPVIIDHDNDTVEYSLVSTKELNELKERVSALENKFKFGTEDPEEALVDSPSGTIYIQIEKD